MGESDQILLTVEQIEQWEREAADLAHRIAEDQASLEDLRQKLKYAQFFKPKKSPFNDFFTAEPNASPAQQAPASAPWAKPADPWPKPAQPTLVNDSADLTAAIERIANASARPVAKKALKATLAAEGFAPDRLANYFYTAIHRLKGKERITVLDDGSVWKAPAVLEANSN